MKILITGLLTFVVALLALEGDLLGMGANPDILYSFMDIGFTIATTVTLAYIWSK